MISFLVNQYTHMHWANGKLIEVLARDGGAVEEAVGLMGHIVSAEHVWLSRLCGREAALVPWSRLTLPECQDYAAANCAGYLELIPGLDGERLREPVSFVLTSGKAMSSTVGDILCHVPVHGSHHRGQICRILSRNHIAPPGIDYIVYSMQAGQ